MHESIEGEYSGANLGDRRRELRLLVLSSDLAKAPGQSFPKALGDGASLEGGYRFMSNPAVEPGEILKPHQRETVLRCAAAESVIVAHDTTEFVFRGEPREGLGRIRGKKKNGFFAHVALAVSADAVRKPHGVLHVETWTRPDVQSNSNKIAPRKRQQMKERESTRWFRGVCAVEEQLRPGQAIHVADREADIFESIAKMSENNCRFVVRSVHDRRTLENQNLTGSGALEPILMEREVPLTKRKGSALPVTRSIHPPRSARIAQLSIKAYSVELKRPEGLIDLPTSLPINVVIVEELKPPEGQPAVYWRLCTNEPIKMPEDIARIIDAYRARWRIEEFFKAIKTGCAFEKCQLESLHALENALAIYIPIAWRALLHRSLVVEKAEVPASQVMTLLQLQILRARSIRSLPDSPTVSDALWAVAGLGGHLKRNGFPGWITILRGYEELLLLEQGALWQQRCDQS